MWTAIGAGLLVTAVPSIGTAHADDVPSPMGSGATTGAASGAGTTSVPESGKPAHTGAASGAAGATNSMPAGAPAQGMAPGGEQAAGSAMSSANNPLPNAQNAPPQDLPSAEGQRDGGHGATREPDDPTMPADPKLPADTDVSNTSADSKNPENLPDVTAPKDGPTAADPGDLPMRSTGLDGQ